MLARHFIVAVILATVAILGPVLLPGKPQAISAHESASNLADKGVDARVL
jgi:hypothetical protein